MNVLDRLDTSLRVLGGHRLEGSVETHGSKNAALPIMAAALLARTPVTLHRVPRITDVDIMGELLGAMGVDVRRGATPDTRPADPATTQPVRTIRGEDATRPVQ